MVKVLLSGDGFVTVDVLARALASQLPEADTVTLANEWPLKPVGDVAGVREAQGDEERLIEALRGCDVCFTHTATRHREGARGVPGPENGHRLRRGPVNADADAATRHGVLLTFTPGRNATATAEHSVAMIMAAVRQIAQRHGELVSGEWRGDYYLYDQVGPEIAGSTVGLVGYGAIGSRVAAIMVALGARVLVFDPYLSVDLPAGVERVGDLDALLGQSSIVTIHARETAENRGLIGARELALMPAGSILVNCARGGLLDYDALCDALDSGHLFAAACDVLPFEPLPPDHRILRTPRLTVTPHLAGASKQAAELAADIGAADIAAFVRGERPRYVANPTVLG